MRKIRLPAASALSAFFALTVIGVLSAPAESHADRSVRLMHASSNKCIVPHDFNYKDGTKLVLHGAYCYGDHALVDFRYDHDKRRIVHVDTRQCIAPEDRQVKPREGTRIVLGRCHEVSAEFAITRGRFLRHNSGKCVHVKPGGGSNPISANDNAELVLREGCRGERLAFKLIDSASPQPQQRETKLTHRFSGLCAKPEGNRTDNNTTIVLTTRGCDLYITARSFVLQPNGAIRHLDTAKCLHPHGGRLTPYNNTRLVLHDGCERAGILFRVLETGAIQHQFSGMCIHPSGGDVIPKDGTGLVLHKGCEGKRLEFDFSLQYGS